MAQLIDGKVISAQIKDEVKEKVAGLKEQGCEVTLAVIQVGADPAEPMSTAFWCSCRYRNILTKKRYWIPFLL